MLQPETPFTEKAVVAASLVIARGFRLSARDCFFCWKRSQGTHLDVKHAWVWTPTKVKRNRATGQP